MRQTCCFPFFATIKQFGKKSQFSFSNTKNADTATPTTGGGWYASVPEPSTAMLALAGLALLIKRRRA